MFKFKLIFIIFFFFFAAQPVLAIVNPLAVSNNRFGIHILEPEDLLPAAKLVNSQGGDWGYITLIIRQNDRSQEKWQAVFDELRRFHLIPIIRIATEAKDNYWVKPELQDVDAWVKFLNSLNWVIKNRYVILFNEPNHALEWGNQLDPSEYAAIVKQFHQKLKSASADFFLLPAGFDTAAPNSRGTLSAVSYWQKMYQADPTIFTLFDGWNSHSYPNPNFSGSPSATGLGSLQSYLTEFNYLKSFGLRPDLPIFISETGWTHKDGQILGTSDPDSDALGNFYVQAFTQIWTQPNLIAVTPFILNYQDTPFNQFSWQIPRSREFYPHYYRVASLSKIFGQPVQVHNSLLDKADIPESLVDSSQYQFKIKFKNTGQSIWNPADFSLLITSNFPPDLIKTGSLSATEPGQTAEFTIDLTTPSIHNSYQFNFQLKFKDETFGEKYATNIVVVPPPTIIAKVKLLFKKSVSAADFKLLVYDADNQLQAKLPLAISFGQSQPIPLYNLIPNNFYRFVIIKPYYLPRQLFARLNTDKTYINFKVLLPFDFNQDQRLSLIDYFSALLQPLTNFRLYCFWCQ